MVIIMYGLLESFRGAHTQLDLDTKRHFEEMSNVFFGKMDVKSSRKLQLGDN